MSAQAFGSRGSYECGCLGSMYVVPDDAQGEARVFGTFGGCRVLGSACTIQVDRLEDNDSAARDILGYASFRVGGLSIHVSGLDDYGEKTGAGVIRAIGMYQVKWATPGHHATGTGCDRPDPAVIVQHDGDDWQHFVFFHAADAFFTLDGIREWARETEGNSFTPREVIEWLNARRSRYSPLDKQHVGAVKRLLDAGCAGDSALVERVCGRYRFTEAS